MMQPSGPCPARVDAERVLSRTIAGPKSCILWVGGKVKGYGVLKHPLRYAHRIVYSAFKGVIPKELVVRHTCDVPACCNPNHLVLGTRGDNIRDAFERGQLKTKVPADIVQKLRSGELSPTQVAAGYGVTAEYANNIKLGWKR